MLDAPALQQRVEVPGAVGRPVVGHDPLHGDAQPLVERERPGHEAAGRALPLVGQQLGVGDAAVVVDRYVQAREPGPARGAAAAPEGPVAAAVGYASHERLAPLRGEFCVRMLGHGRPLLSGNLDNSQLGRGLSICHHSGVNNLLTLNI